MNSGVLKKAILEQIKKDFHSFLIKSFDHITGGRGFLDNWHINMFCDVLSRIYHQKGSKKIIINLPPRYLKSVCFSVAFPAWVLGIDPTARIIVVTYSNLLSIKHASDTRKIMHSDWYKLAFPESKIAYGSDTKRKFSTEKNGYYFCTSVNGTLTGEGGDIIIVDDPHNPAKIGSDKERKKVYDWFNSVLLSRLDNKKTGKVILVMQRLHDEDLSGMLTKKQGSEWQQIVVPVLSEVDQDIEFDSVPYYGRKKNEPLHREREDIFTIKTIKNDLGTYNFNAQYQQAPMVKEDGLVKKKWLTYYGALDTNLINRTIVSIDCASDTKTSSDYSVIMVISSDDQANHYIVDVIRDRMAYPDLKKKCLSVIDKFSPDAVLIEDKSNGSALIQELLREGKKIVSIKPIKDKLSRFMPALISIENGSLLIPTSATYTDELTNELLSFPYGKHDDQIDAISQYFNWISRLKINNPKIRWL